MTRASAAQIQEEASLWVARMDSDQWNDAAEAELEAWIETDPRHDGALLAAQAAWSMLDPRRAAEEIAEPEADESEVIAKGLSRRHMLAGIAGLAAASVAAAVLIGRHGVSYETEMGEIRRVPLADGSTAALNTASRIDVAFQARERRITIAQGEVWFQVAKDKERPFIVEAGPIRVRAVGTAFSVRRRDDGADVLVTEGVVEAWSETDGRRARISAGNGAFVPDHAAIALLPQSPSAVDRSLAWRAGKVDLLGQPLSAAVAEFNRYNRRQIVIADPGLEKEAFDGVFRTDDPIGFAQMVHVSLDVPVDLSDPDKILIGLPKP